MNVSWNIIIFEDIVGSIMTLSIAIWCAFLARKWSNKRPDDVFRQYIFLLTIAIVFFAISRSFGHLIKQILLYLGMVTTWKQIAPFSGAINSSTFVVIFAFGIYFHRFKEVHLEIEQYRNNLEEMIAQRTMELKESNLALATEQERLAVTLRSIGDGVITTNMAGRIVLLNKVAEQLTGWHQDEAMGRHLNEIFQLLNKKGEPYHIPMDTTLQAGSVTTLPDMTTLVAKNGKQLDIADSVAPIRNNESNIIGAVLVFRDVSHQLQLEEEVLKVKKLESLGILAGGIAHDFNNILAAILGNINLALLDNSLTGTTKDLLSSAEKASLRAKDLTQQLLTFSKGGTPVKVTALLPEIIRESANFILHGEPTACIYNFPEDLYPVDIDKGQISQVIQNIIINGKQAMPEGGVIKIACSNISAEETPLQLPVAINYVKISISDNGPGIPPDTISKIFDPYFSTKSEGSGLGLTICHSIINKHHGRISAESSPQQGTSFTIMLPASPHKATITAHKKPQQITAVKKCKVLIMDDEELIREVTTAILSKLGHNSVSACNGEEALKLFKEAKSSSAPVNLTIMDLTIPGGMGGKEAIKELLKIEPEAKVIVSSGYSNDPVMAHFQEYGFKAALVKPYKHQELLEMIQRLLADS